MNDTEEKEGKLQAALEEYKTVSAEFQQYTQEGMRCFAYAGILIALYLGLGITGDASQTTALQMKVQEYVPYGFVLLLVYFLSMAYVREGLGRYRAHLEARINGILGADIMQFDSKYSPAVTGQGFLKLGKAWYNRIPTPPLFLALLITAATIVVFTSDLIRRQTIVLLTMIGACAFTALYIYIIYPRLLDRTYNRVNSDLTINHTKKSRNSKKK
jgi:cytochrome bd-type quinol oxidase subunit 2